MRRMLVFSYISQAGSAVLLLLAWWQLYQTIERGSFLLAAIQVVVIAANAANIVVAGWVATSWRGLIERERQITGG